MSWIVRYSANEAASGNAPPQLLDASANAQHLALAYGSGALEYTEDGAGRGLNMIAGLRSTTAGASAAATAALIAALSGRQQFTIYFKAGAGFVGASSYTNVFEVSVGGTPLLYFRAGGANTRMLGFAGHEAATDSVGTLYAMVVDTTQPVAADRVKVYRSNTDVPEAIALFSSTIAEDDVVADLTGGLVWFLNTAAGSRNPTGIAKFFGIWDAADSLAQVTTTFEALYADDDADPRPAPTLSFLAAPSVDLQTATTYRLSFTSSMTVPYHVIRGTPGQGIGDMPDDTAFDAATITGTAAAGTVMREVFNAQTPETTYPLFVRIGSNPYAYAYVEATTLAVSNSIISINGGDPIYRGQLGVVVTMDGGAPAAGPVLLNGVEQTGFIRDSDTQFRFDFSAWPATIYGNTATLTIDGKTATTPPIDVPDGESVTTLAGYSENPPDTLDFTADAVDGDQVVIEDQGGKIILQPDGPLIIYPGAVSPLRYAIVDHTDGSHSAFFDQPFTMPSGITPDPAELGADVTGAEPNTEYTGSDTLAGDGLDNGVDKTIVATGAMQVSTTAGSGWTTSIVRQKGQAWYWRMFSPVAGAVATGGVTIDGIASVKSITSRAVLVPTDITPAQPASVTQGAQASFTIAGTGIATVEWSVNGVVYPSHTGLTFTTTQNTPGAYTIGWVPRSAEGGAAPQGTTTLTVIAAATRLQIPEIKNPVTGAVRSNQQIPVRVFGVSGNTRTQRLATTITTAASGGTQLDSNLIGAIGEQVEIEYLGTDGTWVGQTLTVVAAS